MPTPRQNDAYLKALWYGFGQQDATSFKVNLSGGAEFANWYAEGYSNDRDDMQPNTRGTIQGAFKFFIQQEESIQLEWAEHARMKMFTPKSE